MSHWFQSGLVYPAAVEGPKVRVRSKSFVDHFGQATLFFNCPSFEVAPDGNMPHTEKAVPQFVWRTAHQ